LELQNIPLENALFSTRSTVPWWGRKQNYFASVGKQMQGANVPCNLARTFSHMINLMRWISYTPALASDNPAGRPSLKPCEAKVGMPKEKSGKASRV